MNTSNLDKAKQAINKIKHALIEPELYKGITESLVNDFGYNRVTVRKADWDRGILSLYCHLGFIDEMPAFEIPLSEDMGVLAETAIRGKSVSVLSADDLPPELKNLVDKSQLTPEMRSDSFAVVPIKTMNLVRAIITVDRHTSYGTLTQEDVEILELVSEMTSALLENLVRHEELDMALIRDDLTQVFNRSYFVRRLREEFERSKRYALPLSCCMFDIDNFKNINDTFGHLFGDHVLIQITRAVSEIVRHADILARYGGEEFTILYTHTKLEKAIVAVERIRRALEKISFQQNTDDSLQITATFGISSYPPLRTIKAEELIHYADMALYEGKKKYNRNCIVYYNGNEYEMVKPTDSFDEIEER
ncbi:MAG: sensor domain-containing diguanylate cyclase [Candidatus Dadabacteria bacterium]|nr:sensor domain-containing diguanylate cyclase [Candidatus Dadabacteria bacterium]